MLNRGQRLGRRGESLAVAHLKRNGYTVLEQNYRTKIGEIDIIAKDRETIVFVEVKSRQSAQYGHPKWAITPAKQRKISMVALYYLKMAKLSHVKARFDVVTIAPGTPRPDIEIIKNAFELAYT